MISAANYTASVLVTLLAGYKLLRVRQTPSEATVRHLCAFLFFLAVGLMVMAPVSLVAASHVEPVPNLARLVGNVLEMAAARAIALFAYSVVSPQLARQRAAPTLAGLGVAAATMAVLLVSGHTRFTLNFVNAYSKSAPIVAYEGVFFCYIAVCLLLFTHLIHRYARDSTQPLLTVALRIILGGAGLGVGWVAWSGVRPLITFVTGQPLATTKPVGTVVGTVDIGSWLVGLTLMAWASYLTGPVRWARSYLAYRRLGPLWTALREAVPDAVGQVRHTSLGWDAEFALCQRVIEIRDAQFALRAHVPSAVDEWLDDLGDAAPVTPQFREAAELAAAIETVRAGHRAPAGGAPARDRGVGNRIEPSIMAEVEWLVRVGRELTGSPLVRDLRRLVSAG